MIADIELDKELLRGSNFGNGKKRIFAACKEDTTIKEKASFLKEEYGIGGYSAPGMPYMVSYDSRGIELRSETERRSWNWLQVAERIASLIASGSYESGQLLEEQMTLF